MSGSAVFGVPPGADFVRHLHQMIRDLSADHAPEYIAGVTVLVPTRRMQRRLITQFEEAGPGFLPKIGLATDIRHLLPPGPLPATNPGLARLFALKPVVSQLVALDDRLSGSDVIDLTISLTKLLDEMQGEGVPLQQLEALDTGDQSGHWEQSLGFLRAIRHYVEVLDDTVRDPEALHRANVLALCANWQTDPPKRPVILAGSTGSRATTRLLMGAVTKLPMGRVLLPGFDFDLSPELWENLTEGAGFEDHPQYRFARFLREIDLTPAEVARFGEAPVPARNRLLSLALRPAPVTDQWLSAGPKLGQLPPVTADLTLIEAQDSKQEATALAIAIRGELEQGRSVALIAPDATLARRVSADLKRWKILPDDSGGVPLSLTPSGRFLRQTAPIAQGARDVAQLIALLKHPMTRHGATRGSHMRLTQELELFVRQKGLAEIDSGVLRDFAARNGEAANWANDISEVLSDATQSGSRPVRQHVEAHRQIVTLFAGPEGMAEFERGDAGQKTVAILNEFAEMDGPDAEVTEAEYSQLLDRTLAADSARIEFGAHPDVMIWGALEARVQGADVVMIAGLNEGTWPAQPPADPWLNRAMRRDIGLLLPDRQIGLAAHDFQQAFGAPCVILSRAKRSDGSETVPSRWLSRLTNLLSGLAETGGDIALREMTARGDSHLSQAAALDRPRGAITPARRPAPAPPLAARPRDFAITEVQRLIRDPYAIYTSRILGIRPLNPLVPQMDARRKGTVFHKILERFFDPEVAFDDPAYAHARLDEIARDLMAANVPNPATRLAWLSQLDDNAEWLFDGEVGRRVTGKPIGNEIRGHYALPGTAFTLRGTADRIDRLNDGRLVIFDYKTGAPPKPKDILHYDRQLILEAVMAEHGGFRDLPPGSVAYVSHLGVGRSPKEQVTELVDENETARAPAELAVLLKAFLDPDKGYVARRAMEDVRFDGDYDHLARFGEWSDAMTPSTERVGP